MTTGSTQMRAAAFATAAAIVALLLAAPAAFARHSKIIPPPAPNSGGCDEHERTYLRNAWREAYASVYQADKLLEYIKAQPKADRAELWGRDWERDDESTPSPRQFFGSYTSDRLATVALAIDRIRRRLEGHGPGIPGKISLMWCRNDCPVNYDGDRKTPNEETPAYHFDRGTIVICPRFWSNVSKSGGKVAYGAGTIVHESFHWLKLDNGFYVTDYHGDGAGGLKDKKYYRFENAKYLSKNKPAWAIRNNDNYAIFIRAVRNAAEPKFTGVFADKESPSVGALLGESTWQSLVLEALKHAGAGQYLADVETSLRHGQRIYTGVWRFGGGGHAPIRLPAAAFFADWAERRHTYDLIDIETYRDNGETWFLGLYRAKAPGALAGIFGIGMSWDTLLDEDDKNAASFYLADVESYVHGGERRYLGVWRAGPGSLDDVVLESGADEFQEAKIELDPTHQMIDYEAWSGDGFVWRLGVWRSGAQGRERQNAVPWPKFLESWKKLHGSRTLTDIEDVSGLPAQVL